MQISSITTIPQHDAPAVNHLSTTINTPQPDNIDSNDLSTVAPNQSPQLGTNAVTTPIDDDIVKEIKDEHDKHKLKHANKQAMKVLKAGAKMIVKSVKEELKDLIKSLGLTGQTNAAVRHELNDFSKAIRGEVKDARHEGNIDAAALGEAFQAEFDEFYSRLGHLLANASGIPGDDDDHSVDLDPSDFESIDVDPGDLAPQFTAQVEVTQNDLTPNDQTPIPVTSDADPEIVGVTTPAITPDDGQTAPSDPLPDPLDGIVLAFQEALANLMDNLDLSALTSRHPGLGHGLLRGLMIDTHG